MWCYHQYNQVTKKGKIFFKTSFYEIIYQYWYEIGGTNYLFITSPYFLKREPWLAREHCLLKGDNLIQDGTARLRSHQDNGSGRSLPAIRIARTGKLHILGDGEHMP
jgi:hypothetical protein